MAARPATALHHWQPGEATIVCRVLYAFLFAIFIFSIILSVVAVGTVFFRQKLRPTGTFYLSWFVGYAIFILFFTGPKTGDVYPEPKSSSYKLPWKAGTARFVSQGNRSFTSHRDTFEHSWDFWMPIGTEILAARSGVITEIEDSLDGIGLRSNFILIQHEDGTFANYAHIRYHGSAVKVGDIVKQGQVIAYSGMVGQTINPHLHFNVFNSTKTDSIPISFSEVPSGVPLAGRFYTSENDGR